MGKRTIFNGRLEFKNQKSFDRVRGLYEQRVETFYKDDILIRMEQLSEDGGNTITIPKHVGEGSEKSWKNTVQLLEYLSQYAISGKVQAWMTENGQVLLSSDIEPDGDKAAIINYKKGVELHNSGQQEEAIEVFDKVLTLYNEHSLALEKRAYSKLFMQDSDGALEDFCLSLAIYDENPDAHLGRSRVYLEREMYAEALEDLEKTLKYSVPMQSVFWTGRRLKAKAHLALDEISKASFELKYFTKRSYSDDDPNAQWKRAAWTQYALVLWSLGDMDEAAVAISKAQKYPVITGISDKEIKAYKKDIESGTAWSMDMPTLL